MKIKELRDMIANLKDDATISFLMDSGCCGDDESMDAYDFETYEDLALIIRLSSLPGYKSCIQADGTLEADEKYWKNK